jgi:hypothetical protein
MIKKFLVIVLILFMAFFLVSNFKITGKSLNTGYLNVTLDMVVVINFTTDMVDFGIGQVTSGEFNATIDTIGNCVGGNWTPKNEGFVLENMGNLGVFLDLKSEKTAETFLGGTNPEYKFNVTNIEEDSCISPISFSLGEWYDVNTTSPGTRICDFFNYSNNKDTIRIDISLTIPFDSKKGLQTDTFTATATAT